MANKENIFLGIFSAVFLFSIVMLIFSNSQITGYATTGSAVSNVTITNFVSITMSTNLQLGVLFGSVSDLPATDVNATHSYDGASDASTMFLNVSTDSNSAVNFCIQANAALTSSGGNVIGLTNQTYNNDTTTSATVPSVSVQTALTTSYVAAGEDVEKGDSTYYRFWLDVPVATAAATYNNSIMFKGVQTGAGC